MNALVQIAARAAERNLPVVLAGGHAVIAHGYQRTTFDADLAVRRQDRNRWLELMQELGFIVFHEGPAFLQFNPPPETRPPVDLIFTSDETFEQLQAAALANPQGPQYPRVISLRHLVAMKCHAVKYGHPGRIVKDADDLIHLFAANRLDPDAVEWRELILKYGNTQLHEKLRRACGT